MIISIFSVPFDDTTLIGYTIAYLIQLIGSSVICSIIYTITSFFFGVCYYFKALLIDSCSIFSEIDEFYQIKGREPTKTDYYSVLTERVKVRNLLKKFVETHIDAVRFIEHFGELMSGTIFVTFAISITWICTSLFQFHAVSSTQTH